MRGMMRPPAERMSRAAASERRASPAHRARRCARKMSANGGTATADVSDFHASVNRTRWRLAVAVPTSLAMEAAAVCRPRQTEEARRDSGCLDTAPASAADRKSADVSAALTFITRSDTKPVFHSSAYTGGAPRVFFDTERHGVPIRDMRPLAGALSLDHEGFELRRHRDRRARSVRRRCARAGLLPGDRGAAARRDRRNAASSSSTPRGAPMAAPAPGTGTACAARPAGCMWTTPRRAARSGSRTSWARPRPQRLAASGARIIQINVWRPIRGPVERSPLALADASSVRPEDLIATDQVFPDRVGEIYHLAYHPAQRWYYAPADDAGRGAADQGLGQPDRRPRPLHPARRLRPARHARATLRRARASRCGRWW